MRVPFAKACVALAVVLFSIGGLLPAVPHSLALAGGLLIITLMLMAALTS